MNSIKRLFFKRSHFSICAIALSLSGCASLPSISDLNPFTSNHAEDGHKNASSQLNIDYFNEGPKVVPLTAEIKEVQEKERLTETIDNLASQGEEWQKMKPALNRLVKLESELTYLMEQLSVDTNSPGFSIADNDRKFLVAQESSSGPKFETASEMLKFQTAANSQGIEQNTQPMVQARPVPKRVITTPDDGVNSNKFSGAARQPISTSATTDEVDDRKFYGVATMSQNVNPNQTACNFPSLGNGFSMHLASFKNRKSAADMLVRARMEFSQTQDCQYPALIQTVEVNGETFFSARLGAFENRDLAVQACSRVKQKQNYCGVTQNIGTPL